MTRVAKTFFALALALAVGACDTRTERTDGGGVLLSIEDFDGLPIIVSVNGGIIQIEEVTIANIAKEPGGATSSLMNVEIHSYEVTYTRADAGTRIPVPFIRGLFGVAPVNGTVVFENGGIDTETGDDRIALNLRLRFFGRTLSGDEVETAPAAFTIDFTP
jgi:hypothetical protein